MSSINSLQCHSLTSITTGWTWGNGDQNKNETCFDTGNLWYTVVKVGTVWKCVDRGGTECRKEKCFFSLALFVSLCTNVLPHVSTRHSFHFPTLTQIFMCGNHAVKSVDGPRESNWILYHVSLLIMITLWSLCIFIWSATCDYCCLQVTCRTYFVRVWLLYGNMAFILFLSELFFKSVSVRKRAMFCRYMMETM